MHLTYEGRPQKSNHMKTQLKATLASLVAASISTFACAQNTPTEIKLVNAYGEPAGFGNLPQAVVALPATSQFITSSSAPGTAGLYPLKGSVDRRNFESMGSWTARSESAATANVNLGELEILDSGPTGPITMDAQAAATTEVTGAVLVRINATDKVMSSLKVRASNLDDASKARFQVAASEVAQRRTTLREDLKTMRQSATAQWSDARSAVSTSYNAYVQSQHRAEEAVVQTTSPSDN